MTLSEIRQSNLPEADKKMYFYDRMLTLICLKQHNMDKYSEILPFYNYWRLLATGKTRLRRETMEYVTRKVMNHYMRLRFTDIKANGLVTIWRG